MSIQIPIVISVIALVVILIAVIKVYNILVIKDTEIQVQEGQVNAILQKRDDLTGQLSVLTKRAYQFEGTTQTRSAKLRNSGKSAGFIATAEDYPALHSINSNFAFFQEQLADIEKILRAERITYNDLVGDYKKYVRSFPIFLISYPLGFTSDRYEIFSTLALDKPEFWKGKGRLENEEE